MPVMMPVEYARPNENNDSALELEFSHVCKATSFLSSQTLPMRHMVAHVQHVIMCMCMSMCGAAGGQRRHFDQAVTTYEAKLMYSCMKRGTCQKRKTIRNCSTPRTAFARLRDLAALH